MGGAEFLDRKLYEAPYSQPYEDERANLEHTLGHLMFQGIMDAPQADRALAGYDEWVALGKPKLTTMDGIPIFDTPKAL